MKTYLKLDHAIHDNREHWIIHHTSDQFFAESLDLFWSIIAKEVLPKGRSAGRQYLKLDTQLDSGSIIAYTYRNSMLDRDEPSIAQLISTHIISKFETLFETQLSEAEIEREVTKMKEATIAIVERARQRSVQASKILPENLFYDYGNRAGE